jgi:cyclic pyranopterin phosphate synthase
MPIHKGEIVSLNISEEKGTAKIPHEKVKLLKDHGVEGDAHAGPWHRQVSLLAIESIEKLKIPIESGRLAENITTKGVVLHTLKIGTKISLGNSELVITQIGKECHNSCAIKEEVGVCVVPTEGIFAKVISGGEIFVGDEIIVNC